MTNAPSLSPDSFFNLSTFSHSKVFDGCGYVWQALAQLKKYLKEQRLGNIEVQLPPNVYLENPELISIGEGTVVESGVYIKGPCIIGRNNELRHGAYIRGNVIVGDECVIGHTTELKHAIILNRAKAAHFAFIGDSILGNEINLGAGVKCANLRLDGTTISVNCEGESIQTDLRKFGAIIGDRCQIGCNVVLNPGTLFGKESVCFPSLAIGGIIPPNKIVRPAIRQAVIEDF